MTAAQNKEIVLRFIEQVHNLGNMALVDELVAPDYAGGGRDREGFSRGIKVKRDTFPDIHHTIEDVAAEGDRVWVRWTMRGTYCGTPISGLPVSGRPFELDEVEIFRLRDGKIVEMWNLWSELRLWRQLGVIPPLDELIAKAKG